MLLRILAVLLSSLALMPGAARAAAIVIWPVDPKIAADQRATALWIENKGGEPVTMQIRTMRWSQGAEGDRHADQDEIVVSPPIAVIPAGQRQLIRVLRREQARGAAAAPAGPGERSYRLLIDEIPTASTPGATPRPAAQLAVQMRYSVPLFTYAGAVADARPELGVTTEAGAGRRMLVIHNAGALHARLVDIRAADDRKTVLVPGLAGYVLAGQTMRWPLPDTARTSAAIVANVNGADQRIGVR